LVTVDVSKIGFFLFDFYILPKWTSVLHSLKVDAIFTSSLTLLGKQNSTSIDATVISAFDDCDEIIAHVSNLIWTWRWLSNFKFL